MIDKEKYNKHILELIRKVLDAEMENINDKDKLLAHNVHIIALAQSAGFSLGIMSIIDNADEKTTIRRLDDCFEVMYSSCQQFKKENDPKKRH